MSPKAGAEDELVSKKKNEMNGNSVLSFKEKPKVSTKKTVLAYLVCFTSIGLLCISAASVQLLGGSVPKFQLNCWRFGFQFLFALPFITFQRKCRISVGLKDAGLLVGITVTFILFNLCFYTAAGIMPIGTLVGIKNGIALIGSSLLSLRKKEQRDVFVLLIAAIAVGGVLLLTQPDFVFSGVQLYHNPPTNWTSSCLMETHQNMTLTNINLFNLNSETFGYVLAIISGFTDVACISLIQAFVQNNHPNIMVFWSGLACFAISLITSLSLETFTIPSASMCVFFLILHGIGSSQFNVAQSFCLQYIPPVIFIIMLSFTLVINLIFQYTWLNHVYPGLGNWVELVGAALVLLGAVCGPVRQIIKDRKSKKGAPMLSKDDNLGGSLVSLA